MILGRMHWHVAGMCVILAGLFTSAAFFRISPGYAQYRALNALTREHAGLIHLEGAVRGEALRGDLGFGSFGAALRVSYAPVYLINNQWIDLPDIHNFPQYIFSAIKFTKRLSSVRDGQVRFYRYAFATNEALGRLGSRNIFLQSGEVWLAADSFLPARVLIDIKHADDAISSFIADISYANPFPQGVPPQRALSDVLAQLHNLAGPYSQMVALPPLASARGALPRFTSDLDYDNLSDTLEMFYGTDPVNPDTDNDTFLDGDEIERGYNPKGAGLLE